MFFDTNAQKCARIICSISSLDERLSNFGRTSAQELAFASGRTRAHLSNAAARLIQAMTAVDAPVIETHVNAAKSLTLLARTHFVSVDSELLGWLDRVDTDVAKLLALVRKAEDPLLTIVNPDGVAAGLDLLAEYKSDPAEHASCLSGLMASVLFAIADGSVVRGQTCALLISQYVVINPIAEETV